jgi:hypothetical protein
MIFLMLLVTASTSLTFTNSCLLAIHPGLYHKADRLKGAGGNERQNTHLISSGLISGGKRLLTVRRFGANGSNRPEQR